MIEALPPSVRPLLRHNKHPGLALDKYLPCCDEQGQPPARFSEQVQKQALNRVVNLSQQEPPEFYYGPLFARWRKSLDDLKAHRLECQTLGPLTLHLSRASALENAGLCLHPLYGFAYLPGSGLKGMARAFAETLWKPAQPEAPRADDSLLAVFGNEPGEPDPARQKAGSIVFHDAWPTQWPKLLLDIVNNHHPDYYQSKGHGAPGDWENPVPVYFLAVGPNTTFSFALSKRKPGVPDALLSLAQEWLLGALCHLGAGAKTAAGYGAFRRHPAQGTSTPIPDHRFAEAVFSVEFISPAFLGGAQNEDLDPAQPFRPATLKALLRRWWRAMHGHLDLDSLRKQEGTLFGDTDLGQGVVVRVETQNIRVLDIGWDAGPGGSPLGYMGYGPIQYQKPHKSNRSTRRAIDAGSTFRITLRHRSPEMLKQAVKALWLFGALGGVGSRSRRGWGSILVTPSPPNVWPENLPDLSVAPDPDALDQMLLRGLSILVPESIRRPANQTTCQLDWTAIGQDSRFIVSRASQPTWRQALESVAQQLQVFRNRYGRNRAGGQPGPDYHFSKAILQPGSYSDYQPPNRLPERAGFGLPYAQEYRSLRPDNQERDKQKRAQPYRVEYIAVPRGSAPDADGRRASPVFFKLHRLADGRVVWLVSFLPARFVPDQHEMRLKETRLGPTGKPRKALVALPAPVQKPGPCGVPGRALGTAPEAASSVPAGSTLVLEFLKTLDLPIAPPPSRPSVPSALKRNPPRSPRAPAASKSPTPAPEPQLLKSGGIVQALLSPEKTKKEGWKAQEKATSLTGPIVNSADVPAEKKAGDEVTLIVVSNNPQNPSFRWPSPADLERAKQAKPRPRPPQDRDRRRHR